MGLFGSKKKTYVNTSVTRLIEDEAIPNMGKTATMEYVLQNQAISTRVDRKSITECFSDQVNNSLPVKMRSARNYAKNGYYHYGLPSNSILKKEGVNIPTEIQNYLEGSLGTPILLKYAFFGPVNNLHFLRKMLIEQYGYNPVTNELTYFSDVISKAYLQDAQIVYCKDTIVNLNNPDTIFQFGYSATSGKTDFRLEDLKRKQTDWAEEVTAPNDYAVVYVSKKNSEGNEVVTTFNLNFLQYEHSGPPPEDGLDSSNTGDLDPNRDQVGNVVDIFESKDYFQAYYEVEQAGSVNRVYFTYEYGSGGIPQLDTLFQSDVGIGEYLPNIYARLKGKKLNKDEYKDTEAFKTSKKIARKLDIDYDSWVEELHKQIGSLQYVKQILMTSALQLNTDHDELTMNYVYDYFMEMYERMPANFAKTEYRNLRTEYVSGMAKVGETFVLEDNVYKQSISFDAIGYEDILGTIGPIGTVTKSHAFKIVVSSELTLFPTSSKIGIHYFRKQITSTVYREIRVYALTNTQYVDGGYTTVANNNDDNLLIPFDISVLDKYSLQERNTLYCKSLVIVLHTVRVVKQKWYETGIFKAIMFVVAVIASIFTGGAGITLYSVLYAIVQAVAISLIIKVVTKLLVKVGINVGVVFAVLAVIAIIYGGYLQLSNTTGIAGVTAQQMLQVANTAFRISNGGQQLEVQKIQKAYTEYSDILNAKMDALQQEALKLGINLNPTYELLSTPPSTIDIRLGEMAADFIDRTKSGVDLSKVVLSLPENYVDISVSLPTIQDFNRNYQTEDLNYVDV